VYQACSLDVYQKDPRMARVHLLRDNGFGVITVDDNGQTTIQIPAQPLAQHIPLEGPVGSLSLDQKLSGLNSALKVKFRAAHSTYQTSVGQGLQEAGQIIEALINCICAQAEAALVVPVGTTARISTANKIDEMYNTAAFQSHRAALGAARSFVKDFRNIASHPAKGPQQAADKIRNCKAGFFEALRIAGELRAVIQSLGYRVVIH
jgi:hypothetical protein